ncbi:uncharacterized protein BDR25DRAFT_309270 [Lindgomyces ingoldianus]|uniref:Uncharacterized protein n=1 Tax=Lindgomyces ingoldianus TaxID=673940 RepID=A0ACB6RF25_9PLEO|nr:uncharacterized protein BDR25DRAFT_309270 [Lindgomyces ingoldianus]KAF2476932.1 hypothetical protein BDR25DRAFT_309270 [Lindgomyces ingoldianus]
MEPTAIFAALNSAVKFAELLVRVVEVRTENDVFVRTIQIVRNDLNEVERLLGIESVQKKLTAVPGKFEWIGGAIISTKSALSDIAKWVERARVDQQATGTVRLDTRIRWVFNDHEKLINRQTELSTCHQQLSNVLNFLNPLEEIPTSSAPPTYRDITYFDDIVSPNQKRRSLMKGAQTTTTVRDAKIEGLLRSTHPAEDSDLRVNLTLMESSSGSPAPLLSRTDPLQQIEVQKSAVRTILDLPKFASTPSETISPAASPPPAYTLISQTSWTGESRRTEDGGSEYLAPSTKRTPSEHVLADTPLLQPHNAKVNSMNNTQPSSQPVEKPSLYAVTQEKPQRLIAELAGDTPSLSGTNAQGPVNPYELYASPPPGTGQSTLSPFGPPCRHVHAISEMLGDLSFPVELSTNDPGRPPGYPRPGAGRAIYELPAQVLSRRPVRNQSLGDSLMAAHKLPSPHDTGNTKHIARQELPDSRRTLSSESIEAQQQRIEMPSPLSVTHQSKYLRYPSPDSGSFLSSPALNPTSTAPFPLSSPSPGTSTLSSVDIGSVSLMGRPTARIISPNKPETASAARMRSQRAIMDMLGSIDQT